MDGMPARARSIYTARSRHDKTARYVRIREGTRVPDPGSVRHAVNSTLNIKPR